MEVHHHPDIHHNRKKFREYFLEFLMIFLAVTMGFIAENIREDIANAHREKSLMLSMLEDLKSDSASISVSIAFTNYVAAGLDTLSNVLFEEPRITADPEIYRLNSSYMRLVSTNYSDQTSSQLKAGGMINIKNREVANGISHYWGTVKGIELSQENYRARMGNATEVAYKIFNGKFTHTLAIDSVTFASVVDIDPAAKLMITDEAILVNYGNYIRVLRNILKTFYMRNLDKQLKECLKLKSLILKQYHIST